MKNPNKHGFTLIELLAVIVILAIILAIAIPSISGIIGDTNKGAFESDAKMIIKAIDYKRLSNESFDATTINEGNISTILGIANTNYGDLSITMEDNKMFVTIIGTGKWDGLVACGDFKNMKVVQSVNDCTIDLVFPVITMLGDNPVNINVGDTYIDMGSTALDNKDGDITSDIITTGTVNPNIPGTYSITYRVSDLKGNETSVTRTINVIDNVSPVISFVPMGNTTYAKGRNTVVTVTDTSNVNSESLKYVWTTSSDQPETNLFTNTFVSGETINTPIVTGAYYLWITASDIVGNMAITRSDVFNLDNEIPVIALNGSANVVAYKGGTYIDSGVTITDNISTGLVPTVSSNVNTNVLGSYTVTYNVSDNAGNAAIEVVRNVVVAYEDYIIAEGVNKPKLATGMTPIKWNGSAWISTTEADSDWYNYTTTDKKWANAKTADGSLWVWIPRYAYQINSGYHVNLAGAGTINVKFLKDKTNIASDDSTAVVTPTYSGSVQTNYIVHPAFTFGSTELTGIWVAKFEASAPTNNICYTSANATNCNVSTIVPVFVPNVSSLRYTNVGNQFTMARNMETNNIYGWGTSGTDIDTHLMKNVEWGATVYLSQSTYGKNAEIWINNSSTYITGCAGSSVSATQFAGCQNSYDTVGGQQASSTGNIYGIYDINGGAGEYVAAYVNNSNANLTANGNSIINADSKYKDVYNVTTDSASNNYNNAINKKGDAVYEISNSYTNQTSWYGDFSYMVFSTDPWFVRGGDYGDGMGGGSFFFGNYTGGGFSFNSFRGVLVVGASM